MGSKKGFLSALFLIFSIILLLEFAECRPHIRHHREGSHCSRCGPGMGVVKRCSPGKDTECGRCSSGTYSPHHSIQPCWICSRCGPGLYEAHPCTTKMDTICDSCHRHAPENFDYQRKCKGRANFFLAPEDAENTGEESILVNDADDDVDDPHDKYQLLKKDVDAIFSKSDENFNGIQSL
ncbi:uncharacterized protein LOC127281266 [Leptopilina boulardi]|uniref:uncharacterized protein LOC127281266 n=1 Tax=Leptopilina boulardi TaxID=63433 RepID=UPI0021F5F779|nr:uncharacterized protein LOC127281266 [Leptopilina boulardi]